MFTKQQASQLRQEFWTTFGRYMSPVTSAEGMKTNWINYKTGQKDIIFHMEADENTTRISIKLTHRDKEIRFLLFEQFVELKPLLNNCLGEDWTWKKEAYDESRETSRIYKEQNGYNIMKKEEWPNIISFLKPRIIALDEFWTSASHIFGSTK